MSFTCPVTDQRFVLDHVVRIGELTNDADLVDAVLEGAAALAEGEFAPLNKSGDEQKARWNDGDVTMPPGFKQAWQAFVQGGWMGLSAPESAGGQGLPLSLSAALMEDLNGANLAFALCPMLSFGAIEAIERHGSDELRRDYLPKIASGEWPATMNLTEPQAAATWGPSRLVPNRTATAAGV
jgi:alkylation response protein AidB-like acyl-CoA dehydrogenase